MSEIQSPYFLQSAGNASGSIRQRVEWLEANLKMVGINATSDTLVTALGESMLDISKTTSVINIVNADGEKLASILPSPLSTTGWLFGQADGWKLATVDEFSIEETTTLQDLVTWMADAEHSTKIASDSDLLQVAQQVYENTQAIQAIAVTGGASVASAVVFPDGETLSTKMSRKTEKIRVDIVGNSPETYQFKLGTQVLNFADLNNLLQNSPNFCVFVHGNREHRCTLIDLDSNPKQMRFVAPLLSDGLLKTQSVYVTSENGTDIKSITVSNINSENKTDADALRARVTVQEQKVSDLSAKILTNGAEILPSHTISGAYVRNNNTISPHDIKSVDVYDVSGLDKVFVEAYCDVPAYFAPFAFSETLQDVGGSVFGAIKIDTNTYNGLVDVPKNAQYIYITHQDGVNKLYSVISKADKALSEINVILQVELPSKANDVEYKNTKADVLDLTKDVRAISGGNYVIYPTWYDGAYDSSGNKTIASGKCTDKIDIQGCPKIVLHGTFASGSGRCIVLYKDGNVYQTIQESTLFDGIELNVEGLSHIAFSFVTNVDKVITIITIGELPIIKSDLYGRIENLDITFITGKAYNSGDKMNHPSIGSGKYTNAIDVSGYKKITITGTLASGSGRRTIMYNQGGDIVAQPTEEDIFNGNNTFDIKGIKFICFSFASGSQPIITGDKIGGIKAAVTYIPTNKNKIVCWGDSLTNAGIFEQEIQDYVGDTYQVINCGIQGETPYDISARCGAMPMFLKNNVTLPDNLSAVAIGTLEDSGMQVINEQGELTNTRALKMYASVADDAVNPIIIDGIECILNWNGSSYTLSRKDTGDQVTLKAGEQMFPSATRYFRNPHCVVVWIGTNKGDGERSTWDYTSKDGIKNTLLKQVKNIIQATGADNYIVVGLHSINTTSSEYLESVFSAEFGSAFFNLRKYCISNALRDGGITPTADDISRINEGRCPSSLLKDGIHFTNLGYSLVGQQILKRMKILGIVK